MIYRVWRGVTRPDAADDYVEHLEREVLPEIHVLGGQAVVLRRETEDGTEFMVMTIWPSLETIRGFAGEDIGRAVVPPEAERLMKTFDPHVTHYDLAIEYPAPHEPDGGAT